MISATCPECRHQYQLDEAKFPRDTVSVTCSQCQTRFSVRKDGTQPSAALGPKALVVGVPVSGLVEAVRSIGLEPVPVADAAAARDYYLREFPPLVILVPQQLTPPPIDDYSPILSMSPGDRRRAFFLLVAEKLRSMDGNAAFLYGVNAVLSSKDIGRFDQVWREASAYHETLYSAMKAAAAPGLT